jgi:hypothetical protein
MFLAGILQAFGIHQFLNQSCKAIIWEILNLSAISIIDKKLKALQQCIDYKSSGHTLPINCNQDEMISHNVNATPMSQESYFNHSTTQF